MHKPIITYKIATWVWLMVTFLRDRGLSIKGNVKEIPYLHGANVKVQIGIVILQTTKHRIEPLLGLPLAGFTRSCPGQAVRIILDDDAGALAI